MKTKQTILCGFLALIFTLTFAACPDDNNGDNDKGETPPAGISVPGSTLAEKLAWVLLPANVTNGETYVITVGADVSINPFTFSYTNRSNITIILLGSGAKRIISLSSNGNLFRVGNSVTLVLDNNITLQGRNDNNNPVVNVLIGGTLEMRDGAKITGNITSTGSAGGVFINATSSTFTMNGGEISGNTATNGGGVNNNGTFTMNGGVISGNTASGSISASKGGGVLNDRTFTMNGGVISDNTADIGGGVLNNSGTFTMNGGTISGNSATGSSSDGGGVYNAGTFRIVNGTIYGSNETNVSLKNNAATSGAALYVHNSATQTQRGTFSGTMWTSKGTFSTTSNTIKVVNGDLAQ